MIQHLFRLSVILALMLPDWAPAQGLPMPWVRPQFLQNSGALLANGFVCSFKAGTSTLQSVFADSALSSALPNPVRLNASARPQTGGNTETEVYLNPGASYKFILYAAGTGNTCNGVTVGTQIWSQDNIASGITTLICDTTINPCATDVVGATVTVVATTPTIALATASSSASVLSLSAVANTYTAIASNQTGSGSYLPLAFFTNGAEQMRLTTTRQLYVGNTTQDLSLGSIPSVVTIGNNSGLVAIGATANASYFRVSMANGIGASLNSSRTGSGAYLPMIFYTSDTEQMRLLTNSQLLVGGSSSDFSANSLVETIGNTGGFVAAGATSNASIVSMTIFNGSYAQIAADKTGTGTYLPLVFFTNSFERMRLLTGGPQLLVGNISTDLSLSTNPYIVTLGNNGGFLAAGATTNASVLSMTVVNGSYASLASNTTGSGTYLPMAFFTNGAEAFRVTAGGSAGRSVVVGATTTDVSVSTPSVLTVGNNSGFVAAGATSNASVLSLTVVNGSYSSIASNRTGSGTYLDMAFFTSATQRATLNTSGSWRWHAYGAGTLTTDASGNITASSDERLKDIQGPLQSGLAEIVRITPIVYHWNAASGMDQGHPYAGFSAQDVQRTLPIAVGRNADGMLTIQDRALLGTAVNAIKELDERLKRLENK